MRLSQRDFDALREGIREQERAEVQREQIQRSFEQRTKREYVEAVELRRAGALRVGDDICATDNGRTFYKDAELMSISPARPPQRSDLWLGLDFYAGGTGGTAASENALVLVARRS